MTAEAAVRPRLVRRAMLLQVAVILYNLFEGIVSIVAGVLAGSVALIGFGLDSAIEVSASIAVLTHLWLNRDDEALEWERRVAMFVGFTLMALAVYVGIRAVYDLIAASEPEESYLGIGIAALSVIVMPFVSNKEHSLSHEIGSRSLEAESRETLMCTYLSAALLIGLGAHALFGWWWADPIAALVIVGFLVKEGWEALTRRELCCAD